MDTVTTDATAPRRLEVGQSIPDPDPANRSVTKLVVAVHGVGDQYSYATLQSVVGQFCHFYGEPSGIPLGAFHTGRKTFCMVGRQVPQLETLAFAEVYWATIPREVVAERHTLEEAKKWASTIIERLKLRWRHAKQPGVCIEADFGLATRILHEMIQTIAVADRLCYLADKAGLFTFDLRQILDDYLGDVQIVTEFEDKRRAIITAFLDTMSGANTECPNADIYVVAHSEGTVVSWLGLLEAFRSASPPAWTGKVRGLMTLGSPIDKHLFLWPELIDGPPPASFPPVKIAWRNYYDYGDPIGFNLDGAREWLGDTHAPDGSTWNDVFEFENGHDIGFTRYPFPGKAHVDYWTDDEVFRHFIGTVVDKPATSPATANDTTPPPAPPQTVKSSWVTSWILPYAGVAALLAVAAFVLWKAVLAVIDPTGTQFGTSQIAKGVAGLTTLLVGVTVAARVPRLTRSRTWRLFAVIVGLACAWAYLLTARGTEPAQWLGIPGGVNLILAVLLTLAVWVMGVLRPNWGTAPMIILGTLLVGGKVAFHIWDAKSEADIGPVWPVFIATAAFLYLWWLAALLFDLIVVWHLYIRSSLINRRIRAITTEWTPPVSAVKPSGAQPSVRSEKPSTAR